MTPEQQKLLEKAQRSIKAAKVLYEQELHEFAVARAYYTMFYSAQALLLGEGLSFSTHSGVLAAFGKQFVRSGRISQEFHRALIEAERERIHGDYDVDELLNEDSARHQINQAEQFLEMATLEIS